MCLIVGDTASTQLLSWRLSLSNCFIILVSNSISSDGLISWKSTKLGSNFYKPNITSKELASLSKCYNSGPVDIIIISGHSITQLNSQLEALSNFIHEDTLIIIDSNFGVELELFSLKKYPETTTFSVIVDAEVRRLSIGSYLLINDSNFFKFGISYNSSIKESVILDNTNRFNDLAKSKTSKFNVMLALLERTNVGSITVVDPQKKVFGLSIWEWLIPRISLNILTIVFEQVSYDELLNNNSNAKIFKQIVQELIEICYKQTGGGKIQNYIINGDKTKPNYNNIVSRVKKRQKELEKFTISEYPEYLTLNYEAYCFYHRIDFPSSLMFKQIIDVAEKYGCQDANLIFLYGFYTRLLSLSGVLIDGAADNNPAKPNLLWGKKYILSMSKEHVTREETQKTVIKCKKQKKKKNPVQSAEKSNLGSSSRSLDLQLPPELQEMYLGCDSINFSSPLTPKLMDIEIETTSDDCEQENSSSDQDTDDSSESTANIGRVVKNKKLAKSLVRVSGISGQQDEDQIDETLKLPFFKGFKNTSQRPMTTGRLEVSDLEWQLRNGYIDFPKQMVLATKHELQHNGAIRQQSVIGQYWKLIKQQHINNGQLTRPITSQEDMLKFHCETLKKAQVHLSTTTNRYGDLDFSDSVFEHWKQGKGGLYKLLSDK